MNTLSESQTKTKKKNKSKIKQTNKKTHKKKHIEAITKPKDASCLNYCVDEEPPYLHYLLKYLGFGS